MNRRPRAEVIMVVPTRDVINLADRQAVGMIEPAYLLSLVYLGRGFVQALSAERDTRSPDHILGGPALTREPGAKLFWRIANHDCPGWIHPRAHCWRTR
jgi:hypothetical protein